MWHTSGTAGEDDAAPSLMVTAHPLDRRVRPSRLTTCLVGKPEGRGSLKAGLRQLWAGSQVLLHPEQPRCVPGLAELS